MSSEIVTFEPELLITSPRNKAGENTIIHDLNQLYDRNRHKIEDCVSTLDDVHQNYLRIITPFAHEVLNRARGDRCVIGDDFIRDLHLRSVWMTETARQIIAAYDRQKRAACNLARMG